MVRYVKCPRCELNYINEEEQEYCDVCIAEMKGNRLKFADLEELEDVNENEFEDVCPVCGVSAIRPGEKMCDNCRFQQEYEDDEDVDMEKDEEWKNYLEEDEGDMSSEPAIQLELPDDDDEYDDFGDEEEEESYEEEDPLDDFEDIGDFDYDDDEDDDDDDEDDEEDF